MIRGCTVYLSEVLVLCARWTCARWTCARWTCARWRTAGGLQTWSLELASRTEVKAELEPELRVERKLEFEPRVILG